MSTSRKKLLIDTDAGVDDAQAILMALQAPDVDVIGITCVMGNADAGQVGLNVLRILKVGNRLDIPVFVGCNEPLLGDKKPTSDYHGSDGFGDAPDKDAPDKSHLQAEHAVPALVRITKEHEGEVTLICIGPLTNVAMAIRMDSKFGPRLKDCYIMGGNHQGKGNMTTSAEFNFYSDPEAAYVVLNQLKSPITIVTWETCEKHSLPWDWFKKFHSSESVCGLFLSNLEKNVISTFYQQFFNQGINKQYEIVDQYAVASAIFDCVILEDAFVYASVELRSELTRGQMVVDWSNVTGNECNVRIVKRINMDFVQKILDKMEFYRKIRSNDNTITNFLRKIEKLSENYAIEQKWETFIPCDEVAVACFLNHDVIKSCSDVYATVEVKGQYTWGQMVVDWNSVLKKNKNVKIVTDIDQTVYETILMKLVAD